MELIKILCRNAKELLRVGLHWRVPFIGSSLGDCTSGLVAGSHNSEEHA